MSDMLKNTKVAPDDYISIKAKVKTEMARRNGTGSVSKYAGSSYDYTVIPTTEDEIALEHIEKIKVPLDAVNSITNPIKDNVIVKELATTDAHLTVLSSIAVTASQANSGCAASCTGLCTSGCKSGCSGCSGCGTSCSYDCSTTCSGTCTGCGSGCADACGDACGGTCTGCGAGCDGSCEGCGTTCSDDCWGCAQGCANDCRTVCGGCADFCTSTNYDYI